LHSCWYLQTASNCSSTSISCCGYTEFGMHVNCTIQISASMISLSSQYVSLLFCRHYFLVFNWTTHSMSDYCVPSLLYHRLLYTYSFHRIPKEYILTYFIHGVLLGKLTGLLLVTKFPAFYGTRGFITAFTSARNLSLS
jgi:hypothetical protein